MKKNQTFLMAFFLAFSFIVSMRVNDGWEQRVFDVFVFCSTVSVSDFSKEVGYFFGVDFFIFFLISMQ